MLDHAAKSSRSEAGTPSSSQITSTGSRNAYEGMRSTRPDGGRAAISSAATCSTRGRSASMRRRVNTRETSLRSLVCSGGSMRIIIGIGVAGCAARSSGGRV